LLVCGIPRIYKVNLLGPSMIIFYTKRRTLIYKDPKNRTSSSSVPKTSMMLTCLTRDASLRAASGNVWARKPKSGHEIDKGSYTRGIMTLPTTTNFYKLLWRNYQWYMILFCGGGIRQTITRVVCISFKGFCIWL
jgi:hypothetical protein